MRLLCIGAGENKNERIKIYENSSKSFEYAACGMYVVYTGSVDDIGGE